MAVERNPNYPWTCQSVACCLLPIQKESEQAAIGEIGTQWHVASLEEILTDSYRWEWHPVACCRFPIQKESELAAICEIGSQ